VEIGDRSQIPQLFLKKLQVIISYSWEAGKWQNADDLFSRMSRILVITAGALSANEFLKGEQGFIFIINGTRRVAKFASEKNIKINLNLKPTG
jgi:hypothetical protein